MAGSLSWAMTTKLKLATKHKQPLILSCLLMAAWQTSGDLQAHSDTVRAPNRLSVTASNRIGVSNVRPMGWSRPPEALYFSPIIGLPSSHLYGSITGQGLGGGEGRRPPEARNTER